MVFIKSLLLMLYFSTINGGIDGARFRFDYTYNKTAEGWLKMHVVPATWKEAMLLCHAEGAVLASPLSSDLKDEMVYMATNYKISTIFTGVHTTFAKGVYASVEGVPLERIPISWAQGEPNNVGNSESCLAMHASDNGTMADFNCNTTLPFICYLKKTKALVITMCGTQDTEYNLEQRTGKCYKFHRNSMTWSQAYMTCMAEGGHLAIINNEQEATVIKELYAKIPESVIVAPKLADYCYLGISAHNGPWMTIHGESLKEAGYEMWVSGEPNNYTQPEGEFCGMMHRNYAYYDTPCSWYLPFICEKYPESLVIDPEDLFNL